PARWAPLRAAQRLCRLAPVGCRTGRYARRTASAYRCLSMLRERHGRSVPSVTDTPPPCEAGRTPKGGGMSRTKIVMAALASLVAGAIIVVYAQWGDNESPALAQTSQEIAQGAEVQKPKAATGSEAPKSEQPPAAKPESEAPKQAQPESAPPPGSPEVIYDF